MCTLSVTGTCLIALTRMSSNACLTVPFADNVTRGEDAIFFNNI